MNGLQKMFDIPLLDKFTEDITNRFTRVSERANVELYGRFKEIENLRQLKDPRGKDHWEKENIQGKLIGWFEMAGKLILRVFLILYFPICWYLICRKGYNIGGTDINNFPYRDPNSNRKSYNNISDIYKQAGGKNAKGGARTPPVQTGGAPLKFTIAGSYDSVEAPYQILTENPTDAFTNIKIWSIDSLASSFAFCRLILATIMALTSPLCGYDNTSESNFLKFIISIPVGFLLCPLILIFGMFFSLLINFLILLLKVKDFWFPFANTRLFSPVAWLFILMLLGLFAPYMSFVLAIIMFLALIYSTIQWAGLSVFMVGSPFFYINHKLKTGEGTEIPRMFKSIGNGVFWVYMIFLLTGPTQLIWGNSAMMGGFLYLIYIIFSKGFIVFDEK